MTTEGATEVIPEVTTEDVWEINRCKPEYIQMYSISNTRKTLVLDHISIYFNKLKYSSEYGGELLLYLNDLVVGRVGMEDKRVVLGENVNLLELLGCQQE